MSQYSSPLGDRSDNLNTYARVCGCMNELKMVHEVRSTEVCEVSPTKNLRGKPAKTRQGKTQENLENDSLWLLVFFDVSALKTIRRGYLRFFDVSTYE